MDAATHRFVRLCQCATAQGPAEFDIATALLMFIGAAVRGRTAEGLKRALSSEIIVSLADAPVAAGDLAVGAECASDCPCARIALCLQALPVIQDTSDSSDAGGSKKYSC